MSARNDLDDETLAAFAERLRGAVLEPGDDGYDDARTVWNATIDRRPAVIARCTGVADVVQAVDVARENGLPVSVKGGGHHVSGAAVREGALTLDLGPMNWVRVDPAARTAVAGPGTTWGEFDRETQQFGLATPGAQDPNVGVAGVTLGGGVGWLSRKYGLTSDNLRSADVVTADGELVHASEDENPELFWALRGGGVTVGVVTAFEFRLHEVGPEILAGSLVYPLDDARAVARRYREFMADAPDEVRLLLGIMTLPDSSYYPESVRGTRVAILVTFYGGDPEAGKEVLAPLRASGDPVMDSIQRRTYTGFQRAGESEPTARTYLRSQYLDTLSEAAIDALVEHGVDAPSGGATVFVSPRGGAETAPAPDATGFPHRSEAHHLLVEARWSDRAADDDHVDWVRRFHEAVRPYTTGEVPSNFLTDDESDDRRRAAYGDNYDRLQAAKAAWDPETLFPTDRFADPAR